jgi:Transcriptional regulator, AbiEi antitoxin
MKRIDRKRGDVFLRADFEDLGGYDQVGRALRQLVRDGRLVKVGQGLYARA